LSGGHRESALAQGGPQGRPATQPVEDFGSREDYTGIIYCGNSGRKPSPAQGGMEGRRTLEDILQTFHPANQRSSFKTAPTGLEFDLKSTHEFD